MGSVAVTTYASRRRTPGLPVRPAVVSSRSAERFAERVSARRAVTRRHLAVGTAVVLAAAVLSWLLLMSPVLALEPRQVVVKDPGTVAAGALYSVRDGASTKLLSDIHISNATCFSPDGGTAYFADGVTRTIRKVSIDKQTGLPNGAWSDFAKVQPPGEPDGAVVDAEGFVWNAQWGAGTVVRFAPDGRVDRVVKVPVSRPTCPALGGKDLKTLYITSAR